VCVCVWEWECNERHVCSAFGQQDSANHLKQKQE
jgi:hypothetical protein